MDRQQRWLEMRNHKTELLADAHVSRNIEECTFHPETNGMAACLTTLSDSLVTKQPGYSAMDSRVSETRKTQARKMGSSKPSLTYSQTDAIDVEEPERTTMNGRDLNPT